MKYHALKRLDVHGVVVLPGDVIEDPTGAERLVDRGFVIRVVEDTPVTIDVWAHLRRHESPDAAPSVEDSEEPTEPTQSEEPEETAEESVDSSEAGSSSEEESTEPEVAPKLHRRKGA
jgi:hypothetical protein